MTGVPSKKKEENSAKKIAAAIRDYHKCQSLLDMLPEFAKLDSVEQAIQYVDYWLGQPRKRNGEFQIHPHQRQISRERRNACRDALLANKDRLAKCKTFEELRSFIANAIPSSRKDGVAIYDMTLRIGAFLGIKPNYVYLHAGAKRGAAQFGIKGRKMVKVEELPEGFRKLKPEIVEDILCIYFGHK
jgi:hypothetical protein